MAIDELVCGTGLTGHAIARHPGQCPGTAFLSHGLHHRAHFPCHGRREHPFADDLLRLTLEERQRHDFAVVGKRHVGPGQLQQADRQSVAIRHGGLFDRLPGRRIAQPPGSLAREARTRQLTEPGTMQHLPMLLWRQRHRHFGGADIARYLDDLRHRQMIVVVFVVHQLVSDPKVVRRFDHAVRAEQAPLQHRCRDEGLDGGARFEGVDHRAVAHQIRLVILAIVGIENRLVGQRENLAGLGVEHHDAAALGFVLLDCRRQFTVCQILDLEIERQGQVAAHLRSLDRRQIANGVAVAVAQDLAFSRSAGQPVLIGAFDAFLSFVVHIGETHHLGSDRTCGIVTAVFAPQRQARQPHGSDLDGLFRSNGTAHAEFAARFVRQDFCQL